MSNTTMMRDSLSSHTWLPHCPICNVMISRGIVGKDVLFNNNEVRELSQFTTAPVKIIRLFGYKRLSCFFFTDQSFP